MARPLWLGGVFVRSHWHTTVHLLARCAGRTRRLCSAVVVAALALAGLAAIARGTPGRRGHIGPHRARSRKDLPGRAHRLAERPAGRVGPERADADPVRRSGRAVRPDLQGLGRGPGVRAAPGHRQHPDRGDRGRLGLRDERHDRRDLVEDLARHAVPHHHLPGPNPGHRRNLDARVRPGHRLGVRHGDGQGDQLRVPPVRAQRQHRRHHAEAADRRPPRATTSTSPSTPSPRTSGPACCS